MAVTRAGNVIRMDADGDSVSGIVDICDIMYVQGGSTDVSLHAGDVSGNLIWEAAMDMCCQAQIRVKEGITLEMTGTGGAVYIYTTVRP